MAEGSAINPSLIQVLRPIQTAQETIESRQQQTALERADAEALKEKGDLEQVRRFEDQRFFVEQVRKDELNHDQRQLANAQEFSDQLLADRRRLVAAQQLTDFQQLLDQQVTDAQVLQDRETARLRATQAIQDQTQSLDERRAAEVQTVVAQQDAARSEIAHGLQDQVQFQKLRDERDQAVADARAADQHQADVRAEAARIADQNTFEEIVFSPQPAIPGIEILPPTPLPPVAQVAQAASDIAAPPAGADAQTISKERAAQDAELADQALASASFNPTRSRGSIVDLVG